MSRLPDYDSHCATKMLEVVLEQDERIAYLESALAARDRAAGKGYTHNRAGQPHWCCAYCRGQECYETCPTVLFPLEGK